MHVWEAGSPGACTPAGEWEAELSSWFVWGLSLLFGAASLVLAVVWASHLPAVLQRWRLKVARRKGSPWKETSDTIPTSTKIAVGLFAANIASVAYHATGFGIARALVCSWPPQALAVVETAHAMVTAGNFSVTGMEAKPTSFLVADITSHPRTHSSGDGGLAEVHDPAEPV